MSGQPNSQILNELKSDIEELKKILGTVSRSNVRKIIANEISTLSTRLETLEAEAKVASDKVEKKTVPTTANVYTTKITNYGWDESTKYVKIYISLPNLEKLTNEQIKCDFTPTSFKFIAHNHNGKNHMLQVLKLADTIVPSASTCRLKNGNIVISFKKEKEGNTWNHLTEAEKRQKEVKDAKYDSSKMDTNDPSAGIMDLMKKMYDEGDDEMKRTIKKSWYESQQKQRSGEIPSL